MTQLVKFIEKGITMRILFSIFLLSLMQLVYAQQNVSRNYVSPSPEASSLGNYAVVPVNPYTGVPDVKIPIYTINLRNFSYDINLSYHSGGVRTNEEASSVGLAWALNSGGVITRTVRHKDDLGTNGFYKIAPGGRPCNDDYDQEPDQFYFNFAGRTGKFFINYFSPGNYVIRKQQREDIYIYLTPMNSFKITDENGNNYEFEQKENLNATRTFGISSFNETYISAWYLTKITTANNDVINFSYVVTGNKSQNVVSNGFNTTFLYAYPDVLMSTNVNIGSMTGAQYYTNNIAPQLTAVNCGDTYLNSDETLISSIGFPNGRIDFVIGDRIDLRMSQSGVLGKKIDEIKILKTTNNNNLLKSFKLTYDYYNSSSGQPNKISKRLRLLSVQETKGNLVLNPYTIEYNTNQLPDKGYGVNQEDYLNTTTQALISKITYPTGGFSNFLFEPHFGGLGARIKSIEQFDGISSSNFKTYEYFGAKKLGSFVNFEIHPMPINVEYSYPGPSNTGYGVYMLQTNYSSSSNRLGESSSSYLVGYDKIIEVNGINGLFGKVEYEYNNIDNTSIANNVPQDISNINGYLKSKSVYKNVNGSYILINKKLTNYELLNEVSLNVNRRYLESCNKNYFIRSSWVRLMDENEISYDDNGINPVNKYKSYNYGGQQFHIQPTEIYEANSKGNTIKVQNKYAYEKSVEVGGVYSQMLGNNLWGTLVQQNVSDINNSTQLSNGITHFKDWFNDGEVITPLLTQIQKGTAPAQDQISFIKYDDHANPTEVVKQDGLPTSYIWDYNKQLVSLEASNAHAQDIGFSSFETDMEGYWRNTNFNASNIVNVAHNGYKGYRIPRGNPVYGPTHDFIATQGGKYVFSCWIRTAIGFTGGNIVIHTSQLGTPDIVYPNNSESYKSITIGSTNGTWQYFEIVLNLDQVKQLSGISSNLNIRCYAYNTNSNMDMYIDDILFRPKNAKTTAYTFDPLIGITSLTDDNNKSTYYDYDDFGRLRIVRDNDKNITKTYCYNYTGQTEQCNTIYSSSSFSKVFARSNCTGGTTGGNYQYSVPNGLYTSLISQNDADLKALEDVDLNGQNAANQYGVCNGPMITIRGYNAKTSTYQVKFTNTSTGSWYTFYLNPYTYSPNTIGQVPAGTYTVQFYPAGSPVTATFVINGLSQYTSVSATFYNVSIQSTSTASMN